MHKYFLLPFSLAFFILFKRLNSYTHGEMSLAEEPTLVLSTKSKTDRQTYYEKNQDISGGN